MDTPKVFESEYRFCLILWEHEPVRSSELVSLCREQLGWKPTTTYTVIKRLSERGVLVNENSVVRALVTKDDVQAAEIDELVEKKFGGSLPAFLAAFATGTLLGGFLGDRYGRKYVILFSILGAAPFTLALPYLGLGWTVATAVASGLIIASAFSAILVYATELKPDKVGMISGVFFGLMFGLGGIGSAFFGWLADRTSIGFVFRISSLLPLLGIIAVRLPDLQSGKKKK